MTNYTSLVKAVRHILNRGGILLKKYWRRQIQILDVALMITQMMPALGK